MEAALIAATVAAVVTLGIEFAAKPRLEARKERILALHRNTATAEAAFDRLAFEVGRVEAWAKMGEKPWPGRLDAIAERAFRAGEDLTGLVIGDRLHCSKLRREALESVAQLAGFWRTMRELGADEHEQLDFVADVLSPHTDIVHDALIVPWWRPRRRRQLAARIAEQLDHEGY